MKYVLKFFLPLLTVCMISTSFATVNPDISVGALYVVKSGNEYHVRKVVALGSGLIHTRHYSNVFHTLPSRIESKNLQTSAEDILMSVDSFLAEKPIKVGQEKVFEEELEAYRMYVEAASTP